MKHWTKEQRANVEEYKRAVGEKRDAWVVACGGLELPVVNFDGVRTLYVFNPASGEHGFLNMETDIVYRDFELTMPA